MRTVALSAAALAHADGEAGAVPRIRVLQWGLGAMGSGMARLVLDKPGLELVGAVDARPDVVGRDVGEVLGVPAVGITVVDAAGDGAERVLREAGVDVVTLATTSWAREQAPDLRRILGAGIDVVTIAEEAADVAAQSPQLAAELDALARAHGATLLGVGVNPGFVLDLLVVTLTAGCQHVERIEASRVNDLSPFGPTVMRSQGVGVSPEEFEAGVADGRIVGHVGFPESIHLISEALGLGVDRVEQFREPIVSTVRRRTPFVTVEPGMVAGCSHTAVGYAGGVERVRLVHPQQVHPELEGRITGDRIRVHGVPDIDLTIAPEIPGGLATIGMAVNAVPVVAAAPPGLKRVIDLPVPAALMGPSAYRRLW